MSLLLHGPGSGEEQHSRVRKASCRAQGSQLFHPRPQLALPGAQTPSQLPGRAELPAAREPYARLPQPALQRPHRQHRAYRLVGFCRDDLHCVRIPYNQVAV